MDLEPPYAQRSVIFSWSLFDFANSVLITNGGLYFSQWLVVDHGIRESWFNFSLALTSAAVLITAPTIGSFEDRRNRWWQILWITAIVMFASAIAISVGPRKLQDVRTAVFLNLTLFCVINYCYEISTMFYDSLLAKLVPPSDYGRISGWGFAAGWIGAIVGLIIIYPFAQGSLHLFANPSRIDSFIPAALIYLGLTAGSMIGLARLRRNRTRSQKSRSRVALSSLWPGLKKTNVLAFFGIYFLMSGVVLTIQANMPLYLQIVMNFPDSTKVLLICGFLIIAAIGATITGQIADRIGHKLSLSFVIAGWAIMLALLISSRSVQLFLLAFGFLAALFGSIWTLMRSIFSQIAPESDRVAYFGIYTAAERLAFILMPAIWGSITWVFADLGPARYKVAIGFMIAFVACAFALVPKLSPDATWSET